jgi:hypothetical protein
MTGREEMTEIAPVRMTWTTETVPNSDFNGGQHRQEM